MTTLLSSTDVPNYTDYIHPLTVEAALTVATDLLPDDRKEIVEGHGNEPFLVLPLAAHIGESYYFTTPDDKIMGAAGLTEGGRIWMLCTKYIHKNPIWFARGAKHFVDNRSEKLLWNIADKRNRTHLKLLKFLGFKFLRELKHGPNNLSFIEFCRV